MNVAQSFLSTRRLVGELSEQLGSLRAVVMPLTH